MPERTAERRANARNRHFWRTETPVVEGRAARPVAHRKAAGASRTRKTLWKHRYAHRLPASAGSRPEQVVLAATAADIDTVVVGGRVVVREGRHLLGDVGALLESAIAALVS